MIKLYRISLTISVLVITIGAMFKIQHWSGGNLLLSIGFLTGLIYTVIGLMEIYKTERKSLFEKLLWLIGFIAFPLIIGLIYYYIELKPKYRIK